MPPELLHGRAAEPHDRPRGDLRPGAGGDELPHAGLLCLLQTEEQLALVEERRLGGVQVLRALHVRLEDAPTEADRPTALVLDREHQPASESLIAVVAEQACGLEDLAHPAFHFGTQQRRRLVRAGQGALLREPERREAQHRGRVQLVGDPDRLAEPRQVREARVALGGVGMTLTDLVQLYGGLAQNGTSRPLKWHSDQQTDTPPSQLFAPRAAWQVGHILASIPPPPGSAARHHGVAYKTGTSYGHRDAWAIGFDGAHVIGVWMGRPDGTPVPGAFGGDLAAPILFEAFGRLKSTSTPRPPPPPDTLLLSNAALPTPLRQFRSRNAVFRPDPNAPKVSFPPSGARLRVNGSDGIPLKVASGKLPLSVLVNGHPVLTDLHGRDVMLPVLDPGFSRIAVIDAAGRSASVGIRID